MASDKKILLSGVKPTGRPHIGNYFGAMKQFVDLQDKGHENNVFIADLHALTSVQNGPELSQSIFDLIVDYLAIGLDPEKTLLYKQSDTPQVTELGWIFNCLATMPYLMRAHAYKAAVDHFEKTSPKQKALDKLIGRVPEVNVGVFDYPLLMAADILITDADIVPVGQDQKQHVEMARDMALKFNNAFGETFKMPKEMIVENLAVVPGTDGQKMSKSYKNTIPLFASDDEIKKAVMGIVTDSSSEIPTNVHAIHRLLKTEAELAPLYAEKKGKYKDLKEALLADMIAFIKPMHEKREAIAADRAGVLKILKEGGEKARARAEKKMGAVRKAIGVSL